MGPFKGINTKIVNKGEGYWALVIADKAIAKQVDPDFDETSAYDVELAAMQSSFNEGKWALIDWRLSNFGLPSPWLLDVSLRDSKFLPTELVQSNSNGFLDKLPYHTVGKVMEFRGTQHTKVTWPIFDGVYITQEQYNAYDHSTRHFVHDYQDAKDILSELKVFWSEFEGACVEEAKSSNPFYNAVNLLLEDGEVTVL